MREATVSFPIQFCQLARKMKRYFTPTRLLAASAAAADVALKYLLLLEILSPLPISACAWKQKNHFKLGECF
jgi:hypothetical protein